MANDNYEPSSSSDSSSSSSDLSSDSPDGGHDAPVPWENNSPLAHVPVPEAIVLAGRGSGTGNAGHAAGHVAGRGAGSGRRGEVILKEAVRLKEAVMAVETSWCIVKVAVL